MIESENIEENTKTIQKTIVNREKIQRLKKLSKASRTKPNNASNYFLVCKCGNFRIDCSSLRLIQKTHIAALDVNMLKDIEDLKKPLSKKPKVTGLTMQTGWKHKGDCKMKLGTISSYEEVEVPLLSLNSFSYQLKTDDRRESVKKWENLPFNVPELSPDLEELFKYQSALIQ